jgi:hypothetical protein
MSEIGLMAYRMGKAKKFCRQQKDLGGTMVSGRMEKGLDTANGGGLPLALDMKTSLRLSPDISLTACLWGPVR